MTYEPNKDKDYILIAVVEAPSAAAAFAAIESIRQQQTGNGFSIGFDRQFVRGEVFCTTREDWMLWQGTLWQRLRRAAQILFRRPPLYYGRTMMYHRDKGD